MVCCVCGNDEDEGLMIQCESCCCWQHGLCIGVDQDSIPESHSCSACSSNLVQSNTNANANTSDPSILNFRSHHSPRLRRAACSVCCRPMSVTQAGVIRAHGPTNSRCSGSNKPPVTNYPAPLITTHSTPLGDPIQAPSISSLSIHPLSVKILKPIPRGSRHCVATKLAVILNEICASGEVEAWDRLFIFPPWCLQAPRRGGHRRSLASQVNKLVELEADPVVASIRPLSKPSSQNLDTLATRVTTKLEEGDFKGAVRLACSEDLLPI